MRGFSAPVRLTGDRHSAELAFLMAHDSDPVARWDAGQALALQVLTDKAQGRPTAEAALIDAIGATLADQRLDPALRARAIALPSMVEIGDALAVYDVPAVFHARRDLAQAIGAALWAPLLDIYHTMGGAHDRDDLSAPAMASRALANGALAYLVASERPAAMALAAAAADVNGTMTNVMAALRALNAIDCVERQQALRAFHDRWQDTELVFDKWLTLEATAPGPGTLARVEALLAHPRYDAGNPNRVRALVGAFCRANPLRFHAEDGSGYAFLTRQVLSLDAKNPMIAARLTNTLARWRRFDAGRQALMRAALTEIVDSPGLSKDCYELASKALA